LIATGKSFVALLKKWLVISLLSEGLPGERVVAVLVDHGNDIAA
jgi:hypothetical protein